MLHSTHEQQALVKLSLIALPERINISASLVIENSRDSYG